MEPITNITEYEARISHIKNVMTSLLRRIDDLGRGPLGEIVNESGIRWGVALVQCLSLHLEKVKKDGEEQCILLRNLCTKYNQELDKLKAEQRVAREDGIAARQSRVNFENEQKAVRSEQGAIVSLVQKVETTMDTRVMTKVAEIVRRFDNLEIQTTNRRKGDLEMVREDKNALQTSLVKLGSVVEAKDTVIVGLQNEIKSLSADLVARDLELRQERDNLTELRRCLDKANSLVQTQAEKLKSQITVQDELNIRIAEQDNELKSFREEAARVLEGTKRDHAEEISQMRKKRAEEVETARIEVERLSKERDDAALNLERSALSESKITQENDDMTARLESAATKEKQYIDRIAKLSEKLNASSQREEQIAKEKAVLSIKSMNATTTETELRMQLDSLSEQVSTAASNHKILLDEKESTTQRLRAADGDVKRLQNELDQLKEQRTKEQGEFVILTKTMRELRDENTSAENVQVRAIALEKELRTEIGRLRFEMAQKEVTVLNFRQLQLDKSLVDTEKALLFKELSTTQEQLRDHKIRLETLEFTSERTQKDSTKRYLPVGGDTTPLSGKNLTERQSKRPRTNKSSSEHRK